MSVRLLAAVPTWESVGRSLVVERPPARGQYGLGFGAGEISLEEKNVRLGFVDLVVLPTETLSAKVRFRPSLGG